MPSPPHDDAQDTNSPTEDVIKRNQMEERYHSLFEFAPDGIVITDMNGIILSVNSAALSLSGYSKDQVVGEHFSKIISMKERDILKLFQIFIFSSHNGCQLSQMLDKLGLIFQEQWQEFQTDFVS